jgi:lysophospholipase L1-like esterase
VSSPRSTGRRARHNPHRKILIWLAGLATTAAAIIVPLTAGAAEGGSDYVALGDSYSAGTGASPYLSNSATIVPVDTLNIINPPASVAHSNNCQRSEKSYAALLAKDNGGPNGFLGSFTFAACAGAVTQDVINRQLAAVNDQTDVITLTIGGNDIKFADAMKECVKPNILLPDCQGHLEESLKLLETELPGRLQPTYNAILNAAPNLSTLVVVGYPRLFDLQGQCTLMEDIFNPIPDVRAVMNDAADQLNQTIRDAVTAVGDPKVRFLNPEPAFEGKGICGPDPFLTEPVTVGISALNDSYHPNDKGHARLKQLVLRVLRS